MVISISFVNYDALRESQLRKCPICERLIHIESFVKCDQCKEIVCVDCMKHGGSKYGVFCVNCFGKLTPEQKKIVLKKDKYIMFLNKYSPYLILLFLIAGVAIIITGASLFSPFGFIGIYFSIIGFSLIGVAIYIGYLTINVLTKCKFKELEDQNQT